MTASRDAGQSCESIRCPRQQPSRTGLERGHGSGPIISAAHDAMRAYLLAKIRGSRCATMCGGWALCSARRLVRQGRGGICRRVERVRACARMRAVARPAHVPDSFRDLRPTELASMPLARRCRGTGVLASSCLANVAEQHHRSARRRAHQLDPHAGPQPPLEETLPRLAAAVSPARGYARRCSSCRSSWW